MDRSSTIVSVASPPGRSARGIVRVSGAAASALAGSVVRFADGIVPARRAVASARILLPQSIDRTPLDVPALALTSAGPRSYTGEDTLELLVVGNPALLDRIIEAVVAAAARLGLPARRAEPGEFTARAFLNGRLDLTQAEGVAAAIAARSDAELAAARRLLAGALGERVRALNAELAGTLALVEAGIDFTDQEDVVAIAPDALRRRLDAAIDSLDEMLAGRAGAERRGAAPLVVLAGPPNAGKSSLFNALVGARRTVVSAVRGTTRDAVIEPIVVPGPIGPTEALLADLPGIDEAIDATGEAIDGAAQGHAHRTIAAADLVLRCAPEGAAVGEGAAGDRPSASGAGRPTILVGTKADRVQGAPADRDVWVSVVDGRGLDRLLALIGARLAARDEAPAGDALAVAPRQRAAVASAREALTAARGADPELAAASIRAALDRLGELVGRIAPDDVIGLVFSRFCVGK